VQDCLTKCYGSSNPKNLVKATLAALDTLRTRETVESLRGVTLETTAVEDAIRKGAAAMPVRRGDKAQAPVNTVGDDRRGGRGGCGGPGRGPGRGRGGFDGGAPSAPSAPSAPEGGAGEAPAAQ